MENIINEIDGNGVFDDASGYVVASKFKDLLVALSGKKGMVDGGMTDMFALSYMASTAGMEELVRLTKLFKAHVSRPCKRYVLSRYVGAGGSNIYLHDTLESIFTYMDDMCFYDEEMTGQFECYDLVAGEDITEKVRGYIVGNRMRYAIEGERDGVTHHNQAETLAEAKTEANKLLRDGICDSVEVFDRLNSGKCVYEYENKG